MPFALITGGGSLIGAGIARSLVRDGWHVAVADIHLENGRKVVAELVKPDRAEAVQLDVTRAEDVKFVVRELLGRHQRIDGLVNCAGGMRGLGIEKKPFAETQPDEWARILDVNLTGLLNCCHAVLPAMIAAKQGNIVSISASRGLRGGPLASIYSAAKAGIIVFSQSLAQEVGAHGIRVNSIAPGNAEARWKKPDTDSTRAPLGRQTSGDDIGDAVAFLLSDRARHITGACLDVSGGTALH